MNTLRNVLKTSRFTYQREVAATVIAYYHDKKANINDLLEAVQDNEVNVRNSAIRGIWCIQDSAGNPNMDLKISPGHYHNSNAKRWSQSLIWPVGKVKATRWQVTGCLEESLVGRTRKFLKAPERIYQP